MNNDHQGYLAAREKWVHEDNLINHRLTWLLNSQTIFFAAYGLVSVYGDMPKIQGDLDKILSILPVVGIVTGLLIFISILGAARALQLLNKNGEYRLGVSDGTHQFGLVCPLLMPFVFIVSWGYVLLPCI